MKKGAFHHDAKHHVTKFKVALANILIMAIIEPSLFYFAGESSNFVKYAVGAGLASIIIAFIEIFLAIIKKKIGFDLNNKIKNPLSHSLIREFSWYFNVLIIPVSIYVLISLFFDIGMSGTPIGAACAMWLTIRTHETRQYKSKGSAQN